MIDFVSSPTNISESLQPLSMEIWDRKYRLRSPDGTIVDKTPEDTFRRVAEGVARSEAPEKRSKWADAFFWALCNGAIPAGRILTTVGAVANGVLGKQSAINCVVSATIEDSLDDILDAVKAAGRTLKAGSGIGYDFSTIRPVGAKVQGNNSNACGPLAVMEMLDQLCGKLVTAGGRLGAQMAVMDIRHPDIFDFVQAKHQRGRLQNFNVSVLVSEEFLKTLRENGDWDLVFPVTPGRADALDSDKIIWTDYPDTGDCVRNTEGLVACEILNTVNARQLWEVIMRSTYTFSEPGVLFIDRINSNNNNRFCEDIRATNPCGEQPLPPSGACLLGSINLAMFVDNPFGASAKFNWDRFEKVTSIFVRFLDNVVDINELPLAEQREEILRKRRHGMGILGLGSALDNAWVALWR